jgi:hypothetical protein
MRNSSKVALVFFGIALILSGCIWYKGEAIRPQIIPQHEKDTPAQSVPPVTQQGQPQLPPGALSDGERQTIAGSRHTGGYCGLTGLDWSGTVKRFQAAYSSKKKPRIAVFLNRALSDEVRDWRVNEGYIVRYGEKGGKQADLDVYPSRGVREEPRPAPGETWMWAFEDGFLEPFMESGVRLVDRATIMRLVAAETQGEGGALAPLAVKKVEVDALRGYANIFVELLISASPGAQYGYAFKATAKDVKTGIIIANVVSVDWKYQPETERRILAGQSDYEVVAENRTPPLDDVASTLALELMSSMARGWGE